MSKRRIDINVPVLARVEGEGALELKIRDDRIEELHLRIYEPPRYFEKFLEGRGYDEVPDTVARICGICPVAYQMSAVQAIESIFGIEVSGWSQAMRRVMYCGEWLQSHSLHIHMLAAPDFLGFNSIIEMAEQHADEVRRGLMLQSLGNDLIALFGGRSVHPVGVRTGGFHKPPAKESILGLVQRLRAALPEAEALIRWTASLDLPEDDQDFPSVALRHPQDYAIESGRIVSDQGLDIGIDAYERHFEEFQVPHSTALHSLLHGQAYLLGPLARLNLNQDRLPAPTRACLDATGIGFPSRNMFHSIVARAVEIHLALVEAIRLLENPPADRNSDPQVVPQAGTGFGCTEAPRGILWHRYELDTAGRVEQARIVPPTSQNQARIEQDLRQSLQHFGLEHDEAGLRLHAEKVIRNYDPCISCATHFLLLDVQHLDTAKSITAIQTAEHVHVIGIGSPGDNDQLGWQVVQQLQQDRQLKNHMPERLTFTTLDRPGTALLTYLKNSALIVLVDSLCSDDPSLAGQIIELDTTALTGSTNGLSSHGLGLAETLSLYHTMHSNDETGPDIHLVGLDTGGAASPPFKPQAVTELAWYIREKLLSFLEPKQPT